MAGCVLMCFHSGRTLRHRVEHAELWPMPDRRGLALRGRVHDGTCRVRTSLFCISRVQSREVCRSRATTFAQSILQRHLMFCLFRANESDHASVSSPAGRPLFLVLLSQWVTSSKKEGEASSCAGPTNKVATSAELSNLALPVSLMVDVFGTYARLASFLHPLLALTLAWPDSLIAGALGTRVSCRSCIRL